MKQCSTHLNEVKKILVGTPVKVKKCSVRYFFERTENDGKFFPDFQILNGFDAALDYAKSIKKLYES